MVKVTIVEPNISEEENQKNLRRIIKALEIIAQDISESENFTVA